MEQLADITTVEVLGGHRLRLTFSDGTIGDVDLSTRKWGGVLAPLEDPLYFASVAVDPDAGTITWPGGLDLAPEPLYEEARRNPVHEAAARS